MSGGGGWLVASVAVFAGVAARRSSETRMEAVARACHELRGPLAAARLGLELGVRVGQLSPAQLRALDLELGRASLALDDLAVVGLRRSRWPHAPGGRRRRAADRLGRGVARSGGHTRARARARARMVGASGARVGRAAAPRAGDGEPDRQRDRARGRGRSAFAGHSRPSITACGSRSSTRARDYRRRSRTWRAARGVDAALAGVGWRSPRRSRTTTVAGWPPRPVKAARGLCSSCPPSPDFSI